MVVGKNQGKAADRVCDKTVRLSHPMGGLDNSISYNNFLSFCIEQNRICHTIICRKEKACTNSKTGKKLWEKG